MQNYTKRRKHRLRRLEGIDHRYFHYFIKPSIDIGQWTIHRYSLGPWVLIIILGKKNWGYIYICKFIHTHTYVYAYINNEKQTNK